MNNNSNCGNNISNSNKLRHLQSSSSSIHSNPKLHEAFSSSDDENDDDLRLEEEEQERLLSEKHGETIELSASSKKNVAV